MNKQSLLYFFEDNEIPIKDDVLLKKRYRYIFNDERFSNNNHFNKNKKKKFNNNFILVIILIILVIIFVFSTFKMINWHLDNKSTNKNIQKTQEIVDLKQIEDNDSTELINEPIVRESDYWYYVKFPLIQVDFDELMKKNSDTVGWIQVNNTNINYPIVQADNNNFYLNHSYDKSINEAGWVFMDFRNNNNFSNKNTIIYAHSRLDKSMFGSLSKVLKNSWYENRDNHIIKISTPTENSLWQIFSVYKIKEESYYITTEFGMNTDYLQFLNTIRDRSLYNFDIILNENDAIITLSTCYSDTERTVVHAKKIKKSIR